MFQALAERMSQIPTLQVRMFLDVPRKQGDTSSADSLIAGFVHQFKTSEWPAGMPLPHVHCCKQFLENVNWKSASLLVKSPVIGERIRRFFETLVDTSCFVRIV